MSVTTGPAPAESRAVRRRRPRPLRVAPLVLLAGGAFAEGAAADGKSSLSGLVKQVPEVSAEVPLTIRAEIPPPLAILLHAETAPGARPPLALGEAELGAEQGRYSLALDLPGLTRLVARRGGVPVAEIPALFVAGDRPVPPLAEPPTAGLLLKGLASPAAREGAKLVVRIAPARPREDCEADWRSAERIEVRDAAAAVRIEAVPRGAAVHVFHPSIGAVRVPAGAGGSFELPAATKPVTAVVRAVAPSGRGVSGATVLFGEGRVPVGRTGADGRLAVSAPAGGWRLEILDPDGGAGAWEGEIDAVAGPGAIRVALEESVRLGGSVVDLDGRPVAGARLWPAREPSVQASTDETGRFELPYPGGLDEVALCVATATRFQGRFEFGAVDPATPRLSPIEVPERSAAEQAPGGSARIRGRVVDALGEPVQGARVAAIPGADDEEMIEVLAGRGGEGGVESGADGTFELAGLATPGEFRLVVSAAGRAARVAGPVELFGEADEADLGDIALDSGRLVEGRVVDAGGRPSRSARVSLAFASPSGGRISGSRTAGHSVAADSDGGFTLAGVPAGIELRLRAEGPGGEVAAKTLPAGTRDAWVELRFEPSMRIVGRVTDASDPSDAPLSSALVTVIREEGAAGAPSGRDGSPPRAARTGDDGRFELRGVPCAPATLRVALEGYAPAEIPIDPIACGETLEIDASLERVPAPG